MTAPCRAALDTRTDAGTVADADGDARRSLAAQGSPVQNRLSESDSGDKFIRPAIEGAGGHGDDGLLERKLALDALPSPAALSARFCAWTGCSPAVRQVTQRDCAPNKTPRHHPLATHNRTLEAMGQGQRRVLLVMATGSGQTQTAFRIIWRPWKDGAKKRIVHLADRNILIDRTRVNAVAPSQARWPI